MSDTNSNNRVVSTESRLYNGSAMLLSGFMSGYFIANSIYYSKISKALAAGHSAGITSMAAKSMLALSIIIAIVCGVLFFWFLYRLIIPFQQRQEIITGLSSAYDDAGLRVKSYLDAESQGLTNYQVGKRN